LGQIHDRGKSMPWQIRGGEQRPPVYSLRASSSSMRVLRGALCTMLLPTVVRLTCAVNTRVWKPAERLCRNSRLGGCDDSAADSKLSVTSTGAAPIDPSGRRSKRVPFSSGGCEGRFGIGAGVTPGIGSPGAAAGG
ncbi:MAG TPA: hypothetical protein VFG04_23750, partial [Planctomycetaceae bacterium]|nr:hypothetical protein [Planctomycetaceae bacterium]